MMRYAVLLDGGFVKRKLASANAPLSGVRIANLIGSIKAHARFADIAKST